MIINKCIIILINYYFLNDFEICLYFYDLKKIFFIVLYEEVSCLKVIFFLSKMMQKINCNKYVLFEKYYIFIEFKI